MFSNLSRIDFMNMSFKDWRDHSTTRLIKASPAATACCCAPCWAAIPMMPGTIEGRKNARNVR